MAFGDLKGTLSVAVNSVLNPTVLTGSVAVAVDDLVYVVFGQQTALTATGATSSFVTTYTATNAGTDSGTVTGRAFWGLVTSAGTLTSISVAATGSTNNASAVAVVIEGPFQSSPLDANPANLEDISSPFTGPATGTLAQADELVVAWEVNGAASNWSATSPNTLRVQRATQAVLTTAIGTQVVAATTTVSPAWTGTNPTDSVLGTTSFKKSLTQTLTPGLYTNDQTFHAPAVTTGPVTMTPGLVTNTQEFFAPTILSIYTLLPGLITNTNDFFSPVITVGAVTLLPGLFTNTNTFFAPEVTQSGGSLELLPELYTNEQTFFTPEVTSVYTLFPSLFTNDQSFFVPEITTIYTLLPGLFTNTSEFFVPTINSIYSLTPGLVTNNQVFFDPTVTSIYNILPGLFVNTNTFFSPGITGGDPGGGGAGNDTLIGGGPEPLHYEMQISRRSRFRGT